MQTAYKLEVFGQDIVFKDKAVLGTPEINFDYLTLESSKLIIKKINVAKGDYIHITDFSGSVVYQGIVKDAGGDKDTSEINVAPLLSIFDVKASFDRTDLETVSLEAFVASIINDLYLDNDDDLQNITGLSVEVLSNTYGATIGLEKNIEELYTIITSALMAYGIIVTPVLYPQTKELKVTIGTATATAIKIEADLDNVTERKFVIGDGYGAVNKLTLINQDDESQQITFFLHMDGTVSTADTDRVTPVFASFEYIGSNDFETNAESRAVKTLSPQQYNNLIELQYSIGDKLIKASSVAIGTPANIISGGNAYRSILTGFDKFGDAIRLVFGIVRIDIHKKLILEKRNGSAMAASSGTGGGTSAPVAITGWVAASGWSYSLVDDPIGVISLSSGHGITVGMRIKFMNGGNTIYGIVVAVTSTTITFLHEIDPTDSQAKYLMADSAITDAYYSPVKAPQGFPMEPTKWTVKAINSNSNIVSSPTSDSWYHLGSFSLVIPIGSWIVEYRNHASAYNFASLTSYLYMYSILETSTGAITSESELFTVDFGVGAQTRSGAAMRCCAPLTLTSKTTYNLYSKYLSNLTAGGIRLNNGTYSFIKATCAYL